MQEEIIEVVGLPGSGKTTWVKKQTRAICLTGDIPRPKRLIGGLLFAIRHPLLFFRLIRLTLKETRGFRLLKHKVSFLLFTALARENYAERNREHSVIIDEGVLQYLLGVFESPITRENEKEIKSIIETLFQRTVFWFDVEQRERVRRMDKRGRIPLSGFGRKYQEKWLRVLEQNAPNILEILKRNKHTVHTL